MSKKSIPEPSHGPNPIRFARWMKGLTGGAALALAVHLSHVSVEVFIFLNFMPVVASEPVVTGS
ncbi:hypothetical protein SAMN06265338_13210 [Rhodoblastus acidophilus]|uniref:Uncharacterized protein n=1 Tax=Rhodoblastus acidophilus TaxID=1074 RepID=A0A212SF26_RHOAC|nr:hypothetical protein [Rhodoblastus acidophilus]SNB84030.1 hypothetical protein SAMN06265338_13210 [Rhodoblastus acidophilus]